jgi:hypothetical protein
MGRRARIPWWWRRLITVRVLMWPPNAKLPRSAPTVLNGRCCARLNMSWSSLGVVLRGLPARGRSVTFPVWRKRCISRTMMEWLALKWSATLLWLKPPLCMPTACYLSGMVNVRAPYQTNRKWNLKLYTKKISFCSQTQMLKSTRGTLHTLCYTQLKIDQWPVSQVSKYVCTGNENSKPIWYKFIIRKDIIETSQVVLNFCRTVYRLNDWLVFNTNFSNIVALTNCIINLDT